jgi:hypothetical protein
MVNQPEMCGRCNAAPAVAQRTIVKIGAKRPTAAQARVMRLCLRCYERELFRNR